VGYLLVFMVALAVGAAVFVLSVREPPETDGGFGQESSLPPPPAAGTTYVPVTTSAPDWQTRLQGLLGLAISVVLAALGLAVAVYFVGSAIAHAVSSTASSGGVKGG
jgi:hypothetical protein